VVTRSSVVVSPRKAPPDKDGQRRGQFGDKAAALLGIYERLYAAHGPQHWWPGESAFEIIVGAILTQSAAWTNVERALANLKAAKPLSPEGIASMTDARLTELVRPSGYFNAKARKLKAFVALLYERFGGDLEQMLATPVDELRPALLGTHGIGPETADSILLYAGHHPVFVIDAYTRRTFLRLGFLPETDTYQGWQALFTGALPANPQLFNEYHALIVRHDKAVCRKRPLCEECPLKEVCPAGQTAVA
jgi:endonuclease-3 related protein